MSEIPTAIPVPFDRDVACIYCGYNLRGLSFDGRCPECGAAINVASRGDLLRYADPAWLARLRFGTTLKLWNILATITIGIVGGLVGNWLFTSGGAFVIEAVLASMAGLLGLWATFAVTTQEPRISLREDPVTLRKVIRACAMAGWIGAIVQQTIGTPQKWSAGRFDMIGVFISVTCGTARIVTMVGELVYLRRFALRIPDLRLAKSTRFLIWAIPASALAAGILVFAFMFLSKTVPPPAPVSAPIGAPISGVVATTTPAGGTPIPMGATVYAILGGGACVFGLAYLVFSIWYVVLLFRYRNAFRDAAVESRALAVDAARTDPPPV